MKRDDVAHWRKAKISIPAASYRVLRNFCFSPIGLKHRTFALIRILIYFDYFPRCKQREIIKFKVKEAMVSAWGDVLSASIMKVLVHMTG